MYDELEKRLRNCATQAAPCLACDMTDDGSCIETLMKQAADAIEELRQQVEHSVPVPPHGRLIEEADAIETAWMILRGLGYLKEKNPQLEKTVREVFATAPTIEVE